MNAINNIFYHIDNFRHNFWNGYGCNVLKVNTLWGLVIIILGLLFQSSQVFFFGIGMSCVLLFILAINLIYLIVKFSVIILYKLLQYTERAYCERSENKFFK